MDCIQDQPQDVSSLLQDTAAQIESVSTMEARHAAEITALFSRQSTEAAELQARQAQEKVVSLSRVLEMHRQLVAKVKLELNNVREASLCVLLGCMTGHSAQAHCPFYKCRTAKALQQKLHK